jgi:TDG/mug DNA glycosylase family protein
MRKAAARPGKLNDLFQPKLIVVFCATAARRRSAAPKQHYADPGNRFWSILADTGLTPRRLAPTESPLLPTFGIGLTDLLRTKPGDDTPLRFGVVDRMGLRTKVLEHQPRFLCFNGTAAAHEFYGIDTIGFGIQGEPIDATNIFVAPSTSPAAWDEWDQRMWEDLAERVLRIRGPVA